MKRSKCIEVLKIVDKDLDIIITIQKRKLQFLNHISRNYKYQLLLVVAQRKIRDKRCVGRHKISWLKNQGEWFGMTSGKLFRVAV